MLHRKVRAYFCLVPVFGSIPAFISLLRDPEGEIKDTAKVALLLFALWITCFWALGGSTPPDTITQIPGEILKGTVSSGYFLTMLWLMFRLAQGRKVALPPVKQQDSDRDR